jgi:hypothetical protein
MQKYSIQTTSDYSYFPFLKVFVNSVLANCSKDHLNNIYVVNTGMDDEQLNYIKSLSTCIKIINTGSTTNFKGGIWGEDWQINVKGKTMWLLNTVNKVQESVLMLDSDMMVTKDLYELLIQGGDIQVCVRQGNSTPYIGSYFFSINKEKSIPFLQKWVEITNSNSGKKPLESPALCETIKLFRPELDIKEQECKTVNVIDPPTFTPETYVVHFKSRTVDDNTNQFHKRVIERGWGEHIKTYLK